MSEGFPNGMSEVPKDVPNFEAIEDALSESEREEYARLSEQAEEIGKKDDADLTSAERLLLDRYKELKAKALSNIRMAE